MTRVLGLLLLLLVLSACGSDKGKSSSEGPVPWLNQPRPRYTIPQPRLIRYPTTAPPCRPSQVRVSRGRTGVATGNLLEELVFTNTGARPCLLRGHPRVTAETPTGERRALHPRPGETFFGQLVPADLAPGGHVFLDFGTSDCGCRCERPNPVRYRELVFGLPQGGSVRGGHAFLDVDCFLYMSSFGLPERYSEPKARQGTAGTLKARLTVPRTVRAGTTLLYTVTLTNPTDVTVVLRPCPGYTEDLRSFALNCDSVHAMPSHAHVRYAMRLRIPQEVPGGVVKVGWRLNTPSGPLAVAAVRVTSG